MGSGLAQPQTPGPVAWGRVGGEGVQGIAFFHGQVRTSTARCGLPRPDRRQPKKKQCNPFMRMSHFSQNSSDGPKELT